MKLPWTLRRLVPVLLVLHVAAAHGAEDPIKVGILHSLSGTMAISESALKDTVLMLVADQNRKGGLLGRKLEPVIVDPASEWETFTDKAFELLSKEKVAVVFGCWTSTSRKAVIPVFERLNGLLFYPVQYEGEESSRNVFYTGAAPSQQAIPAVRYLMSKDGGEVRRWILLGTDYVYPRTTNRILSAYLAGEGVAAEDIMTIYTPFGHSDWREIVARIKAFGSEGKRTAVISTINGDANTHFYRELTAQQVNANALPVLALSVGEREMRDMGVSGLAGQPNIDASCDVRPPWQPQIKFLASYPVPFGVQLGVGFQSLPGPQITASYSATSAQIQPSLGRPLSSGATGTATLQIIPPGTLYGARAQELDLSFRKAFTTGRSRVIATADIFNVLNRSDVLTYNNTFGPQWQRPTSILTARWLKLGVQVDF